MNCRCSIAIATVLTLLAAPASSVTFEWIVIGDPDYCPWGDCGSVADGFRISKYEVTNAQYADFLNAKAASDPLGLYSTAMGRDDAHGGISRAGAPGSYTYTPRSGYAAKPVNNVSFWDALRFANWLHNGQDDGDTESGAYTLLGGTPSPSNGRTVERNPNATVFLPSHSEWYEAGHYDPATATYFGFATGSNTTPSCALPSSTPNTVNCRNVVGTVTDVGAYTGSPSPYGTFDQNGNVWEWYDDLYGGLTRGLRGGEFYQPDVDLGGSGGASAVYEAGNGGFRIATLVPEPVGAGAAALLALLALRRRRQVS